MWVRLPSTPPTFLDFIMNKLSNDYNDSMYSFYPWVGVEDIFSKFELNRIENYCESFNKFDATITDNSEVNKNFRRSKINFHKPNLENKWIFNKLNDIIQLTNDRYYKFDLTGYNLFQYSTYDSNENGYYNWHTDTFFGENKDKHLQRKLSLTLLLNDDFEGGEFSIRYQDEEEIIPCVKGSMILFPSFILHKVKPVTRGIRKSLVVWVDGPKFK